MEDTMLAQFEGTWLCGSYADVANGDPIDRISQTAQMAFRPIVLGGGEWRRTGALHEQDWLVPVARKIHRDFTGIPTGAQSGTAYWHYVSRQVRGTLLLPSIAKHVHGGTTPDLPYARWAKEDRCLVEEVAPGNIPFMRGTPTPFALQFFGGIPRYGEIFEEALVQQINAILADDPTTIIQLELPAELAFVSFGPNFKHKQAIAKRMVEAIGRVIRRTPKGTRFAFHLCWGDLKNHPFVPRPLQSQYSKVALINAILELDVWDEWVLYAIHDPFCDGDHVPTKVEAAYNAYDHLMPIPEGTIYVLGILKSDFGAESTVHVAKLLSRRIRARRFALAAPCGDARKPLEEVATQYRIGRAALTGLAA